MHADDSWNAAQAVSRLRQGDAEALAAIYDRYAKRLWTFAAILAGNDEDARDAVQDVFLSIWRNRATLEVRTSLDAYLYTAVRHRALKIKERSRAIDHVEVPLEELGGTETSKASQAGQSSSSGDIESMVQFEDLQRALDRALQSLSPTQRALVILRWYEQLSYQEIAAAMGMSEGAARTQMTRIIQRLRPLLEDFRR